MVKDFTLNDVVAYLYDELDSENTRGMEHVLTVNDRMKKSYYELEDAKASLPTFDQEPSARTLNRILLYSSINSPSKCN